MEFKNLLPEEVLKSRAVTRKGADVRSDYYRDATAILHSSAFRRLKHKTQVFFAPSNDHICTRVEHVLHVASISQTICRAMGLDDEMAWAIGLGHDLGHTPFGHIGEQIISGITEREGLGVFEHELNSLRVVDFIAHLNLTYAVRDGIISHCGEHFVRTLSPTHEVKNLSEIKTKSGIMPATWEGCVVRLSDQIAYMGRDFEDACRLGIIKQSQLPEKCRKMLGATNGEIINTLVEDIISNSMKEGVIGFTEDIFETVVEMKEFNYKNIYLSPILQGYKKYYCRLINLIFDYLTDLYKEAGLDPAKYKSEGNMLAAGFYNYVQERRDSYFTSDGSDKRLVIDYIAGMSDNFTIDCASEILIPEHLNETIERSQTGKWFDAR